MVILTSLEDSRLCIICAEHRYNWHWCRYLYWIKNNFNAK